MSTLSISQGYETIEEEFEDSLRRAFVVGKADYIVLYDMRHRFLCESIAYGQEKGWLDGGTILSDSSEQSSEARFRLTESGKVHFRLIK